MPLRGGLYVPVLIYRRRFLRSMAGNETSDRGLEGLFFDEVAILIPCRFQYWLAIFETSFYPH